MRIRNVFGPVPSRRLGRSLGVDLVPTKACSFDCIYCQLGRTTYKTVERRAYVPMSDVLMEVEERLAAGAQADYITLSGSGEPTLHSDCGDILRTIKTLTDVPVAVLTNGSLLSDPGIRDELMAADLVIPSLDAGDAETFQRVNRPHPAIDYDAMVDGMAVFSHAFPGRLWLEVFLLDGITATDEQAARIAAQAARLRIDKIQLNTVTRPPTEDAAKAPSRQRLVELAPLFGLQAEVVCDFAGTMEEHEFLAARSRVLDLLQGGPKTLDDLAHLSGVNRNETVKYLEALLNEGLVQSKVRQDIRYFYCEIL